MNYIFNVLFSIWELLLNSSVYMLLGLLFSGFLRIFMNPDTISKHLGKGQFKSVFKAAILGIPLPLCSCGVLPAAVALKKQGANNGAATAFLISTPESGVDSISISYALLDPILTIARPVAAFFMAMIAGITENLFHYKEKKIQKTSFPSQLPLPSINSCKTDYSETDCCENNYNTSDSLETNNNLSIINKLKSGIIYAFKDVWADIAGWFFIGIILAGFIMALIPDEFISQFLSGGISSMLLMLGIGIPIYICATASTPVAAALILKGVSPGTALVFLLAGPATNITSLTVLTGILGKKTCAIYLGTIALFSVVSGLILDQIYNYMNISPQAIIGTASKHIPFWMQLIGVIILIFISLNPFTDKLKKIVQKYKHNSISKNILKHKESG